MAADKKRKRHEQSGATPASDPSGTYADHDSDPSLVHDLSSHEKDEDESSVEPTDAAADAPTGADASVDSSSDSADAAAESMNAESVNAESVNSDPAGSDPAASDSAAAESATDVPDVQIKESVLSDEDAALLDRAAGDIVAEMRADLQFAQAELVNFRTRVERDRMANREAVIAEVIRALLPTIDDLSRAEQHGDLEGSPLELVATKLRAAFDRYGVREVGVKGEPFDPNFHEAVVQLPTPGATSNTVADVLETGYALGERLLRAAKVAVSVPE
ncbi:MAG: nucleotide exchange factor GrpE [Microbacteriaceae bacterium]